MVEELTRKRNRSPITKIIGKALVGITDRPVNLDDTTRGILRTRLHDGNNEFSVEIQKKRPDGRYFCSSAADRPESDPSDPLIHLNSGRFDGRQGSSGSSRPPNGHPAAENPKYPPIPPKSKKHRRLNKTAEKPQPDGEEIDEVW